MPSTPAAIVRRNAEVRIYDQARATFEAHGGTFPATEPTRANAAALLLAMREGEPRRKWIWAERQLADRLLSCWNDTTTEVRT